MNEDFERRFPANPQQAAYWTVDIAGKWVDNQVALDRRFGAITDALIERASPRSGERVVDVGCGTGATTLELARAVGSDGRVLAIDISEPMLEVARRRIEAAGFAWVDLLLADAQVHRFAAGHDLVASRFGVMFFGDPVAAFRNLKAALEPDGRLAFACWTELEANPWFHLPLEAATRRLGPPETKHPRAPGPFAFSEAAYVRQILESAGFTGIRIERTEIPIEIEATCGEEAAFAADMGPASRLIRERAADPAATSQRIAAEIADAFRPFETSAGLRFPSVVFLVTARNV